MSDNSSSRRDFMMAGGLAAAASALTASAQPESGEASDDHLSEATLAEAEKLAAISLTLKERTEVLFVFVRERPGPLHQAQKIDHLCFRPRGEGHPPDSVPEEDPRKALRLVLDGEDELRLPLQAGLANPQPQVGTQLPEPRELFLQRVDRLLTHRVVGQV